MPKSTPMTMDAILDARFMVQPPHQNFGPNLDLLRTEQTTLRLRGVALRRLETALRGGDSVHILLPNKVPVKGYDYAPCATSGFRGGPREGAFCRPYTQPRQPQATLSLPAISL